MKNDNRKHKISFRLNDEEYNIFQHKFELSGFKFQGEFIRKLMLYGLVIRLDKKKYEKVIRDISGIATNVNQIAVRVNSTGNIYANDVSELQKDVNVLWQQLRLFQSELQKLTQ